jgi:hypothetical protein
MVIAPFMSPDEPIPATALAMINIDDERAAPHNAEPISNTARNIRNNHYS